MRRFPWILVAVALTVSPGASGSEPDVATLLAMRPFPFAGLANAEGSYQPQVGGYEESLIGIGGMVSLWREEGDQVLLRANGQSRFIATDLVFPDTGAAIPDRLDSPEPA